MVFSATILAVVSTTLTIGSYVNSALNTANIAYDKAVVGDALQEMRQTQELLKQKALQETDPAKRQQKLAVAEKLGNTHQKLSAFQDKIIVNAGKKEALSLGKGILTGSLDNVVGIADAAADQLVAAKGANKSKVDDVEIWKKLATSSDGLDIEIAKIKTRQTLQDLSGLNDDLAQMVKDLQDQEKKHQIDSDQTEKKLGELIESQPGISSYVLDSLDVDLDGGNNNPSPPKVSQTPPQIEALVPENNSSDSLIVGDWKIQSTSMSGTDISWGLKDNVYRFDAQGNLNYIDSTMKRTHNYKYRFDGERGEVYEFINITAPEWPADTIQDWEQSARDAFSTRNLIYSSTDKTLKLEYLNSEGEKNFHILIKK